MLSTHDFLGKHKLSKDVLLIIMAAADARLAYRLSKTSNTTLLFKFFIYAFGQLNELQRDFPHLCECNESRRLVSPDESLSIPDYLHSLLSSYMGHHSQPSTSANIFIARRIFQQATIKNDMYRNLCFTRPEKSDISALIAAQPYRWNIFSGWHSEIKKLRSIDGFTPLHIAAATGNMPAVAFLVTQDVPLAPFCSNGLTPLYYAVKFGYRDIAKLLVKAMNEQRINLNSTSHLLGITPYFIALELDREDYLFETSEQKNCLALTFKENVAGDNTAAIMAAVACGAVKVFTRLLVAGSRLMGFNYEINDVICDSLALAVGFNEFEITRLLLLHDAESLFAYNAGDIMWINPSRLLTHGIGTQVCKQIEDLTTSPLIKLYVVYAKALAINIEGNTNDINVSDLAIWIKQSDESIKQAAQHLLSDIQEGGFKPHEHVHDLTLKEIMIKNEELFLAEFTKAPGLRAGH